MDSAEEVGHHAMVAPVEKAGFGDRVEHPGLEEPGAWADFVVVVEYHEKEAPGVTADFAEVAGHRDSAELAAMGDFAAEAAPRGLEATGEKAGFDEVAERRAMAVPVSSAAFVLAQTSKAAPSRRSFAGCWRNRRPRLRKAQLIRNGSSLNPPSANGGAKMCQYRPAWVRADIHISDTHI